MPMPPEASPSPVRVLAVASGKGGVGKTNVSVNLATALTALGERVMLLDADFGLANVDVLLGLTPKQTLADVIAGRATLPEVMLTGPRGLLIVPSASGKRHMAEMNPAQHAGIVQAVSAYDGPLDTLVVDTAAGINDAVLTFCQAAQEVLVVVCDEPASITDAYALVKAPSRRMRPCDAPCRSRKPLSTPFPPPRFRPPSASWPAASTAGHGHPHRGGTSNSSSSVCSTPEVPVHDRSRRPVPCRPAQRLGRGRRAPCRSGEAHRPPSCRPAAGQRRGR
jgi:hypothetical protein